MCYTLWFFYCYLSFVSLISRASARESRKLERKGFFSSSRPPRIGTLFGIKSSAPFIRSCVPTPHLGPAICPGPSPDWLNSGVWAWGPRSCGPTSPGDFGPPSNLRGTVLRNSRLAGSSPLIWLEDPKIQQRIQTFGFPLVTILAVLAGSSWVSLSFFIPWFWTAWLCTQQSNFLVSHTSLKWAESLL